MGRGEADFSTLPSTRWLTEIDNWSVVSGVAAIEAPFHLLVDNLLDPSHETYLHNGSIGTPEGATTPIEVEVEEDEHVVRVYRHVTSVECPSFYSRTTGLEVLVDRWRDIEYSPPGNYLLHARIASVGQPPLPDGNDEHAFHLKIVYGLTPSSETSVYDFWALSRDFCVDDVEIDQFLAQCRATSSQMMSTPQISFKSERSLTSSQRK